MARPKPTDQYNAKQERFVRMEAQGAPRADILREVFGIDVATADKKTIHNADCAMSRWRKMAPYEETWKDEVRQTLFGTTGKAIRKIRNQIDDDNGWLANKASNDIITAAKQLGVFGAEENAMEVRIVGMPDIGSPTDDEQDV